MSELIRTIETLGGTVVQWSWQLAIFIGFLWLVVRLDRRHRPEFRYGLWTFALVMSLGLPWALQGIASYSWTIRAREVWTETHAIDMGRIKGNNPAEPRVTETGNNVSFLPYPGEEAAHSSLLTAAVVFRILGLFWIVGIAVGGVRAIRRHQRMQTIVKHGAPLSTRSDSPPAILLSREVTNPSLYGLIRPVILLPHDIESWSTPEERVAIIRHECIHFNKKHHWVATLETLATILLFFHPLVRWMCTQLNSERELVCDAETLRKGADPDGYAETLLLVARHAISGHAGVYFGAKAQLDRRIDFLFRPFRRCRLALAAVPIILLTPLLTLGFWQTRAETFEPIETEWLARLLPPVPKEVPEPVAMTAPSRKPAPEALPPQQVSPTQSQPVSPAVVRDDEGESAKFGMVVSRFNGRETPGSEVHVAVGIPNSRMVFSPNGGTLEASGKVEIQIESNRGGVVARVEEPFLVGFPLSTPIPPTSLAALEKVFKLEPGVYSLSVAVTDSIARSSLAVTKRRLEIPAIPPTLHSASSLILADLIESASGSPSSSFRLGDVRVRPNFTGKLRRDQELKLVQQVYNPASSPLTYETLITTSGREVKRVREDLATSPELTVIKNFPLSDFPPGSYEVETRVTDSSTGLKVGARAHFSVE